MNVQVEALRAALELLLDHVEELEGEVVHLKHDYFWAIDSEQRFDVYSEPTEHTIGSLETSLTEVLRMLDGRSEPVSYGLVWLADVLDAIGREVVR